MTALGSGPTGPLGTMSLDEWAALPEDASGELVDGRIEEEEVPSYVHEVVVAWLIEVLRGWGRPRGVSVVGSGVKLAVAARRGRMADVVAYFPGGPKPAIRGLVRVPPMIAIEVVSASPRDARRDRVEKLDEYAAFGVVYYWIVDPGVRLLEVYERALDGRYVHALGASEGSLTTVPGCEGLTLDLDDLWREVDALGDPPSEP